MAINEVCTIELTNNLYLIEVEITYPDNPDQDHTTYEVHCSSCDGVEMYDDLKQALLSGPIDHVCEPYIGEVD